MAKRNFREVAGVPFGDSTPSNPPNNSLLELDAELYGKIAAVDAQVERIKAIDIFIIEPDPQQPRRAMPSAVRARWNGDPRTISDLFAHWWQLVQEERGTDFPLPAYLLEQDEITNRDRVEEHIGPIEASLVEVIDLAVSIRRDGLANPITVVPLPTDKLTPERYRLETGERRWLAHHLLYQFFEAAEERERWGKIQAREMKTVSVWRQAAENTARQNLNAIGKARQFAILMMDLWERDEKNPKTFKPMSEFQSERAYYAQADIALPYGKREMLLKAMGAKSAAEFTRCRKLLHLPDVVWVMGDDRNLSQDELLKIADREAQAKDEGRIVPSWNDSGKRQASGSASTASAKKNDPALRQGKRLFSSEKASSIRDQIRYLTGLRSGMADANQDTKEGLRYSIHDIRRFLDEVEQLLDKD